KTQVALEYVYWCASESDYDIFWVNGSGVLRFWEGFRAIGQHVQIPVASAETEEEEFLLSVKRWLEGPDSGDWILVIDNAENEEHFTGNYGPISKFVPQGPRGTVIFTTRSRQIALRQGCERIDVGRMEENEALALFAKHYGSRGSLRDGEEEAVSRILASLDYLPLAVVGSAAFMLETQTPPSDYWTIFQENDKRKTQLLSQPFSDIRRDVDITESILSTYFITFDRITEQMPTAGHLLRLIAFFDRQNIPEQLLRESGVGGVDDPVEFRRSVGKLSGFSLVTSTHHENKTFYELHRLVQLSIQAYLSPEELNKWSATALGVISRIFPKYEHELRDICSDYLPHALASLETSFGPGDPDTLRCLSYLASVMSDLGKYGESEKMNRRALEARGKVLGPDHRDTLTSAINLALALQYQGKYKESEAINRRALEGHQRVHGPDHPNTLTSVNTLAALLELQGKHNESEMLNRRALKARDQILGSNHPDTLTSVNNLALVLQRQGKYDESEAANRHALEGRKKILGPDHPDTLLSVSHLAMVLSYREKYKESEEMNRYALQGREKVLGPDHPDTLISAGNLAVVLEYEEKYDESEKMHRRALEGREKVLGQDHPNTLISVSGLAIVLCNQGKYDESEKMYRLALEGREKILGPDHPQTLTSLSNLAFVLQYQRKYDSSERMHRRAVVGREK
ncbi:unnamed protein product, partial [Tuber aestivum]